MVEVYYETVIIRHDKKMKSLAKYRSSKSEMTKTKQFNWSFFAMLFRKFFTVGRRSFIHWLNLNFVHLFYSCIASDIVQLKTNTLYWKIKHWFVFDKQHNFELKISASQSNKIQSHRKKIHISIQKSIIYGKGLFHKSYNWEKMVSQKTQTTITMTEKNP